MGLSIEFHVFIFMLSRGQVWVRYGQVWVRYGGLQPRGLISFRRHRATPRWGLQFLGRTFLTF